MRKLAIAVLCGVVLFGCRQETAPGRAGNTSTVTVPSDVRNAKINEVIPKLPAFMDHSLVGTELGPDGTVKKEDPATLQGTPIYITVWFRESPPGLQAAAIVTTMDKKTLLTERRPMNGAKVTTFNLGNQLKPGRYRVTAYWGGNFATDREFEVLATKPAAKRKKG